MTRHESLGNLSSFFKNRCMTNKLTYSKRRVLGTLIMTVYLLGLLPLSYSKSCTNAEKPGAATTNIALEIRDKKFEVNHSN